MCSGSKSHKQLQIQIVDDASELECWQARWDALAAETPLAAPTNGYAWVSSIVEEYLEPDKDWLCLFATRDAELVAVIPLVVISGAHTRAGRNSYVLLNDNITFVCDLLISNSADSKCLAALGRKIAQTLDICKLACPRTYDRGGTEKIFGQPGKNWLSVREHAGRGSFIDTTSDYDDFRDQLGWIKRNLRRSRRRLKSATSAEPVLRIETKSSEDSLQAFLDLEDSGYKGRSGTSIKNHPRRMRFYKSVTDRLANSGALEWHFLEAEGEIIAAHFAFKWARSLVLSKICYDEKYASCSPGTILFDEIVARAFADPETDRIDLLTDLAWHDRWNVSKQDYISWAIYQKDLVSTIRWATHRGVTSARYSLRKLRNRVRGSLTRTSGGV